MEFILLSFRSNTLHCSSKLDVAGLNISVPRVEYKMVLSHLMLEVFPLHLALSMPLKKWATKELIMLVMKRYPDRKT